MNETITNLNKMLKRLIGEDIELVESFEAGLGEIKADAGQIEQIIMNLVVNARDAMPKGGTLTVETLSKNEKIIIKVKDTGIGIPEEIRDKIFDAFFTTKHTVKGVGLGLSVCYGIIKDHGGDIRLKSKTGKGSTFSIILPKSPFKG